VQLLNNAKIATQNHLIILSSLWKNFRQILMEERQLTVDQLVHGLFHKVKNAIGYRGQLLVYIVLVIQGALLGSHGLCAIGCHHIIYPVAAPQLLAG
jgi:hypothetical protein